jgi:hypothetical protein
MWNYCIQNTENCQNKIKNYSIRKVVDFDQKMFVFLNRIHDQTVEHRSFCRSGVEFEKVIIQSRKISAGLLFVLKRRKISNCCLICCKIYRETDGVVLIQSKIVPLKVFHYRK